MKDLVSIRQKPMKELLPLDWWKIAVNKVLGEIRREANESRINGYRTREFERYLCGKLHQAILNRGAIIYQQGFEAHDEADEIGSAAMNEAEFLFGKYLSGEF